MTFRDGPYVDENHLRQGSPRGTFAETIPRILAGGDLAIAATGVELSVGVPLAAGDIVTNLTFIVGGTALASGTAGYAALRSPSGALLGQSADFGSTARSANTVYTVALASPVVIETPGLYLACISFTASTVPTLRGVTVGNAVVAGNLGLSAAALSKSHSSGVGATAPSTLGTPTNVASVPYLVAT